MIRKGVLLTAALSVLMLGTAPANAVTLTSGACAVKLTFNFTNPVRAADISANTFSYTIGQPLGQSCAVTDALDPLRSTSGHGTGTSSVWTCGAVVASGTANQAFRTSTGEFDPAPVDGIMTIDGTWGAWTMQIQSFLGPAIFLGVLELTADPDFPNELNACAGSGTKTIHMIGVEVFQDPDNPLAGGDGVS